MDTSPFGRYHVQSSSKKRVFPGGDSRSNSVKAREEPWSSFAYKPSNSANGENEVQKQPKSSDIESCYDDFPYNDDGYIDTYHDNLINDRDYALQAHLDSRGIPPGDEASIPWFLSPSSHTGKPSNFPSSNSQMEHGKLTPLSKPDNKPFGSSSSVYSNPRPEINSYKYPYTSVPPSPLPSNSYYTSYTPPPHGNTAHYFSPSQASPAWPSYTTSNPYNSSIKSNGNGTMPWPPALPMFFMPPLPLMPPLSSESTQMYSWFDDYYAFGQPPFEGDDIFSPVGSLPLPHERDLNSHSSPDHARKSLIAVGSASIPLLPNSDVNEEDVIEKFQNFKQFDTVEDFSDHHFLNSLYAVKRPPKNWTKRIHEEWKILEKNLPDKIHVRVCESRIDLLRAAIVGAEGTPYHDGLFFFDLFFPSDYPNVPPLVNYHSGGLGINPNLYSCGKVCLSLLNTWNGEHQSEQWIPNVSTILQVLVSIQALILNEKPYFNEPGFDYMCGSPSGEMQSQQYNESVFTLSLRTMVYSIRKPPKHFEDFVVGHFFKRAQDILGACKAYLEGVQVGCLVNGGGTNDTCSKGCSSYFSAHLTKCIPRLVQTFTQIGAKDLEKFLYLADTGKSQKPTIPIPPASPFEFDPYLNFLTPS